MEGDSVRAPLDGLRAREGKQKTKLTPEGGSSFIRRVPLTPLSAGRALPDVGSGHYGFPVQTESCREKLELCRTFAGPPLTHPQPSRPKTCPGPDRGRRRARPNPPTPCHRLRLGPDWSSVPRPYPANPGRPAEGPSPPRAQPRRNLGGMTILPETHHREQGDP